VDDANGSHAGLLMQKRATQLFAMRHVGNGEWNLISHRGKTLEEHGVNIALKDPRGTNTNQRWRFQVRYHSLRMGLGDVWTQNIIMNSNYDAVSDILVEDGSKRRVRVTITDSQASTTVTIGPDTDESRVNGLPVQSHDQAVIMAASPLEWSCPTCTFKNKEDHLACEMCQEQKPGGGSGGNSGLRLPLKHSNISLNVDLLGFGVSVVDTGKQSEILNLSVGSLRAKVKHAMQSLSEPAEEGVIIKAPLFPVVESGSSQTQLSITTGAVQVDNLLKGSKHPVLLSQAGDESTPFLRVAAVSEYVDSSIQEVGLSSYIQTKCGGETVGDHLPGSGRLCSTIDEAKHYAEQEGHTLGEGCRYIQVAGGKAYFYMAGNQNGKSGPETYRFDRNLSKYPKVKLDVQLAPIQVGVDTDLIMSILSDKTSWSEVLKPCIDPRATFLHLVPAAAPDWRPISLSLVEKMRIMATHWGLSVSLSSEAIDRLLPNCPRLVRRIFKLIHTSGGREWSLTNFPIDTAEYTLTEALSPPDALAGRVADAIGDQVASVDFKNLTTIGSFIGARLGVRGGIEESMVRHAREVHPDVPLSKLNASASKETNAWAEICRKIGAGK